MTVQSIEDFPQVGDHAYVRGPTNDRSSLETQWQILAILDHGIRFKVAKRYGPMIRYTADHQSIERSYGATWLSIQFLPWTGIYELSPDTRPPWPEQETHVEPLSTAY